MCALNKNIRFLFLHIYFQSIQIKSRGSRTEMEQRGNDELVNQHAFHLSGNCQLGKVVALAKHIIYSRNNLK